MHGKEKGPLKISMAKSYGKCPFNDIIDFKEIKCYNVNQTDVAEWD
jgi:hypothetical protein